VNESAVWEEVAMQHLERISPAVDSDAFERAYVAGDRPVIIQGLATAWPAFKRWTLPYLAEKIGDLPVPIAQLDERHGGRTLRRYKMWFRDYARLHLAGSDDESRQYYLAQMNIPDALANDIAIPACVPRDVAVPPKIWIGPRGCTTAMHFDSFHNILVQIEGRKRLVLVSPADRPYLYLNDTRPPQPRTSAIDLRRPDHGAYPLFARARQIEVVLQPGDGLFLPAAWSHFVEAVDRTISVNLWWKVPLAQALRILREDPDQERLRRMWDEYDDILSVFATGMDVRGLDKFGMTMGLWAAGFRDRATSTALGLTDALLRAIAGAPEPHGSPPDEVLRGHAPSPAAGPEGGTESLLAATDALAVQGRLSPTEHAAIRDFLRAPGGCGDLEVTRFLEDAREIARARKLEGLFAAPRPASAPTHGY
jgi:lysine-specific demethylase 8